MVSEDEEVIVAEASVLASRIIEWFQERLLTTEADRDASEGQRDEANQARKAADARVVEVEKLLVASQELADQLRIALESRIVIEQAKGAVANQYGITPEAAFDAIRGFARSHRVKLRDVATDLVAGRMSLEL